MSTSRCNTTVFHIIKRTFITIAPKCQKQPQANLKVGPNTTIKTGQEVSIPVPWGHIAGKEWGLPHGQPIMALHGMQDNCATFDLLAERLPSKYHLVAIDFPGYGLSSPYPANLFASAVNHVVDFKRTLHHFGWKKVTILGHSYGGAIATFITATCPDMIHQLITIETAKPITSHASNAPKYVRAKVDTMLSIEEKLLMKSKSEYNSNKKQLFSYEEAVKAIEERLGHSMTEKSARIMVKRNITLEDPEKHLFKFNFDIKNLLMMHPQFCQAETRQFAKSIGSSCDSLFISADKGIIPEWAIQSDTLPVEQFVKMVAKGGRSTNVQVSGTHHVHLNNPERVAPFVEEFLETSKINPNTKREHPFKILFQPSDFR